MRHALIALLLFPAFLRSTQSADEKQKTIDYVNSLRQADGGFALSKEAKGSSLRATNAAIRSLKYFGGELKQPEKVAEFVKSCFDKEAGTYADTPGEMTSVALTAVGVMAAAQLKLPDDPFIAKAIDCRRRARRASSSRAVRSTRRLNASRHSARARTSRSRPAPKATARRCSTIRTGTASRCLNGHVRNPFSTSPPGSALRTG